MRFLSTPSARRATAGGLCRAGKSADFYPRPPRGGRPGQLLGLLPGHDFYPRPPRGGRLFQSSQLGVQVKFLSTPSARRATYELEHPGQPQAISIHALREEGDSEHSVRRPPAQDFYPRPPRGGRLSTKGIPAAAFRFLSTPSARRATRRIVPNPCNPE